MKRKQFDPKAEDMRAVVPIHNAVNERAWKEIREWERGRGGERYVPDLTDIIPCFWGMTTTKEGEGKRGRLEGGWADACV